MAHVKGLLLLAAVCAAMVLALGQLASALPGASSAFSEARLEQPTPRENDPLLDTVLDDEILGLTPKQARAGQEAPNGDIGGGDTTAAGAAATG